MEKQYGNLKIPDEFVDAISDGNLVLLTGAGVSKEAGLPDGWGLVDEVISMSSVPLANGERPEDYYDRLSALGKEPNKLVNTIIQNRCSEDSINCKHHKTLLNIHELPAYVRVVTINFDLLFDQACQELDMSLSRSVWPSLPQIFENLPLMGIVYLHGAISDDGSPDLILTKHDYWVAYDDYKIAHQFLQNLFRTHSVALIGISADDAIYSHLLSAITGSKLVHFAFVPNADLQDRQTGVQNISYYAENITRIRYEVNGKSHEELWQGLRLIAEACRRRREGEAYD